MNGVDRCSSSIAQGLFAVLSLLFSPTILNLGSLIYKKTGCNVVLSCMHGRCLSMPLRGVQARETLSIGRWCGAGPASEGSDEGVAFLKAQQPGNLCG